MSNDTTDDEGNGNTNGGENPGAADGSGGSEAATGGDGPVDESAENVTEADTLDERARRLDQRERGIESWADDLEEREEELDERERQLAERREELARRRDELEEKKASLTQREQELDDREEAIQSREQELTERANELDRHEETLQTYVQNEVEDLEGIIEENVWSALDAYEDNREGSRFGTAGNLAVGIVGLVLVVAGVGYALGVQFRAFIPPFAGTVNLAISIVLVVAGLVANLASVADRL